MSMRFRLVARWLVGGGMVISVALALLWLGSARFELSLAGEPYFFLRSDATEGVLLFDVLLPKGDGSRDGWGNPGWHLRDTGAIRMRWAPRFIASSPSRRIIIVPLWMPLLGAVSGTLFLRRLFPRRARCQCVHCGYDLSGGDSKASCPECGRKREG